MNDSVIKFKIYAVEMLDLNTNADLFANPAGLLVLVFHCRSADSADHFDLKLVYYFYKS